MRVVPIQSKGVMKLFGFHAAVILICLLQRSVASAQADVSAEVSLTTLYSFGINDGEEPSAGLVEGSDGYFYGTTSAGGAAGGGTVFKIGSDGAFTSLHSFNGGDGNAPSGGLAEGGDGYFYGTTEGGGTKYSGTVFKISSAGEFTSLHSFTGLDGVNPAAGLTQCGDGYFYGTAQIGGANLNDGSVFKISSLGALTSLYSFTGGIDGAGPVAGLTQGSDGYLYGTTAFGGFHGFGTVFKISSTGELTSLHSFTGRDGKGPVARLVQGRDGYFYGTTEFGTATSGGSYGTVFKISSDGTFTNLYSFTGGNDGAYPLAGLVQGNDGYFYGTTEKGGNRLFGLGTAFKISPDGTFTNLYSFTGGNDGAEPVAGLVQGSDGYFYGTTSAGGAAGGGTVFRLAVPLKHRFHKPHGRDDHPDHDETGR